MRNYDVGVLPASEEYFYIASKFAKDTLFFLESGGDYQCDEKYIVRRMEEQIDTFLLEIIQDGTLYLKIEDKTYPVPKGSMFLLDCKRPHLYYAKEKVSFKYFHFSGKMVQNYLDTLYESNGPVFFPEDFVDMSKKFSFIINMMASGNVNEHLASLTIHDIFAHLATNNSLAKVDTSQIIVEAARYMDKFYPENLSIKGLAESSNLSIYYFIRTFKKIHGCTPYEYLTNVRLKNAKNLLLTTKLSVEAISGMVGFSCVSNFVRTFRRELKYTPAQFRNHFNTNQS